MVVLTLTIFTVIVSVFRYVGDTSIQKAIYFKSKKDWKKVIIYSKKSNNTFYNMDNTSIPVKWYAGIAYYNLKKYNSASKYFQDSYEVLNYYQYSRRHMNFVGNNHPMLDLSLHHYLNQ